MEFRTNLRSHARLANQLQRARTLTGCTLVVAATSLFALVGCSSEPTLPSDTGHSGGGPESHDAAQSDADDHAGHNHAEMGSHGGHVVVLDPGHVHAEWVHMDEEEILEVYILDNPDKVTGVKVITTVQGQDPETVELTADESLGTGGFMVKNPNVLTTIQMADGEATTVQLIATTDDGEMSTQLTDSHDHDHSEEHGEDHGEEHDEETPAGDS